MYTDAPIALDKHLISGLAFLGMRKPVKKKKKKDISSFVHGIEIPGRRHSQEKMSIWGKLAISHAPEQPFNAAALHDNAPTGNQAD